MKSKLIYDPCWSANVWLVWPCDNRALDAFIKRMFGIDEATKDDPFLGRAVQVVEDGGEETGTVIALAQWKGTPRDHAILAHECLHATHNILDARGIKFGDETDEVFAYLLDSLVRRSLEFLTKR